MRPSYLAVAFLSLLVHRGVSAQEETEDQSQPLTPVTTYQSSNASAPDWTIALSPDESGQSQLAAGYILVAPRGSSVPQPGPYIYDNDGGLVWSGPASGYGETLAYNVQRYRGEPVISIWQGEFNPNGYGYGHILVLNDRYEVIANVTNEIDGFGIDFHEFIITPNDTALVMYYIPREHDLTAYGIENGWILDNSISEVDIESGEVLFTWNALDHIDPASCYVEAQETGRDQSNAWDYIHLNSIDRDDGGYLISARHCYAAYYIDANTGDVAWKLNGNGSTFSLGPDVAFSYQHDARFHSNGNQISILDNASSGFIRNAEKSRGILITIDRDTKEATLAEAFYPYEDALSGSQCNMQVQTGGNVMIGWGSEPWFTEYDSSGEPILAVQIGQNDITSYQVHRAVWHAVPIWQPSMAISNGSAFVSWNGATNVSEWQIFGSADAANVVPLANASKNGFETTISLDDLEPQRFYQAAAMDSEGHMLGWTQFVSETDDDQPPFSTQTATTTAGAPTAVQSFPAAPTSGAEQQGRRNIPLAVLVFVMVLVM